MDSKGFVKRIREMAAALNLGPFPVFSDAQLPVFHRWIMGTEEFDGTGLRDVVNANAFAVDDLKNDFDDHRTMDNVRHSALAQRVAALEAQQSAPFPESG